MISFAVVPRANAQGAWWEGIKGSGASDFSNGRRTPERAVRTPESEGDLRTGPTPFLSDVMLDAMSSAIARYEKIVSRGGWPVVPAGRMLREGDDDPRVPLLRARLRASGDLSAKSGYYQSETFDSLLTDAVSRFQKRHGLRITGRVERSVFPVLNVSAAERLNQLRLNYDRLRAKMHESSHERYILVNIPAFQLEAVDNFEVRQRHRVIVGRAERQTPDISTTIRALNFFPYWRVPKSVAMLDLVPKLQKEPEYLTNEGIRVFDGYEGPELDRSQINWFSPEVSKYFFKQDPGEKNALGLIRLDMSNEHNVYMHDTPMKTLFDQRSRPFSAGCVRVQGVFDLAEWIASSEPGWERPGQARRVIDSGLPIDLNLQRPMPVIFTYVTAWAEPRSDVIAFRPDIYARDSQTIRDGFIADVDDAPPPEAAAALAP